MPLYLPRCSTYLNKRPLYFSSTAVRLTSFRINSPYQLSNIIEWAYGRWSIWSQLQCVWNIHRSPTYNNFFFKCWVVVKSIFYYAWMGLMKGSQSLTRSQSLTFSKLNSRLSWDLYLLRQVYIYYFLYLGRLRDAFSDYARWKSKNLPFWDIAKVTVVLLFVAVVLPCTVALLLSQPCFDFLHSDTSLGFDINPEQMNWS